MNTTRVINHVSAKTAMKDHYKCSAPKLEDLVIGQTYTLNLNPVEQPASMSKSALLTWYRHTYDLLVEHKENVTIQVYPECSPTGRMHFHGVIVIKNILGYVSFLLSLGKYSYEIDTQLFSDEDEEDTNIYVYADPDENVPLTYSKFWFDYATKQKSIWQTSFERTIIGYPMNIYKSNITK